MSASEDSAAAQTSSPLLPNKDLHQDPVTQIFTDCDNSFLFKLPMSLLPLCQHYLHQIKTLLPGGSWFPVCSLLSHISLLLCWDYQTLFIFYFFFLCHILHAMCLLIRFFVGSSDKTQGLTCISWQFLSTAHGHISGQHSFYPPTYSFTPQLFSPVRLGRTEVGIIITLYCSLKKRLWEDN